MFAPEMDYLKIIISRCQGSATCKSDAEIDEAMNNTTFFVAPTNYFFNTNILWTLLLQTILNGTFKMDLY